MQWRRPLAYITGRVDNELLIGPKFLWGELLGTSSTAPNYALLLRWDA
jgi:hypothetical protein